MSRLLDDAVAELSKLPGIGKRTAMRLALNLLRKDEAEVMELTTAINRFRNDIKHCIHCNNLSDGDICEICSNPDRDKSIICIVENVGDVISIENTNQYNGLYHVLGGVISPMQGISPSDLKIDLLEENIEHGDVKEVIIAISTTVEGETTLYYITRRLSRFKNLRITTIARGIGFGDEIEYANELTIAHALHNRQDITSI